MENNKIIFPCISVQQPIGAFYIGSIDSKDLVSISYSDVRRPDGRDIERYIGTQRDLSEGRVAELKKYVKTIDACFPTAVILAISSEDVIFDEVNNTLSVRKDSEVAKIIDGQHRIAGLEDYNLEVPFMVNVTIFIDMDIEDQAMVFSTINLKQTKVTKSLAYDLYEHAKSRSPQKTAHNIAKLMNFKDDSPFCGRIKILGKATGIGTEVITQATFVDRLLKLVTRDAMSDRDILKRGKPIESIYGRKGENLIFRDFFINNDDAKIAKILWNYFGAARERWPEGWANLDRGFILARTTGFAALLRILPKIWNQEEYVSDVPNKGVFLTYLNKSTLSDNDFTSENFKPGSSGEGALVRKFEEDLF